MPFDALAFQCIAGEIEEKLMDIRARVTKIYQPDAFTLLLHFRSAYQNHILLFSTRPAGARVHFTARHYPSPPVPSSFCMLLRKHLMGASICSLEQPPLERVLKIHFRAISARGHETEKTLVAEIMERRSNLILLDEGDKEGVQLILGAIKAVPPFLNRFRTILPHHPYVPPPSQDKLHPLALDYNFFLKEVGREQGRPVTAFLLDNLQGFSPFLAREIAVRSGRKVISPEAGPPLFEKIQEMLQLTIDNNWEPAMLCDEEGRPRDFAPFIPQQADTGMLRRFTSLSELLDEFYIYRESSEQEKNLRQLIARRVNRYLQKLKKKEKNRRRELENAGRADYYRLCGELLKANLHDLPPGATKVLLPNFFHEGKETTEIALEPRLSPSANAQLYFKKYRKAKSALRQINARLDTTRREIAYLESVLYNTENSNGGELKEIRAELEAAGYLQAPARPSSPGKGIPPSAPRVFTAAGGEEIRVGRNNRQNDLLLRRARADDLWFHAKDMPGAHVILKGVPAEEAAIEAAALLAALHSRGAHSANVPVDYTAVKNVRRIPGAGPGMVTYSNYRTVFVTPDEKKLSQLTGGPTGLHP